MRLSVLAHAKWMLLLAFALILSCKEKKPDSTSQGATLCIKEPCTEAGIAKAKETCLKTVGAKWLDTKDCQIPASLGDCRKVRQDLVWDGIGCVAESNPLNFYRLCAASNLLPAVLDTLNVVKKDFNNSNCQSMNFALSNKTEMVYQNANLVDLTLFQGFDKLVSLDLWNNRIIDLSPLAKLTKLEILKLGHNQIVDLKPLAALTNLKELYLFENAIVNLSELAGLKNLKILDLRSNPIGDYSVVKALNIPDLRTD